MLSQWLQIWLEAGREGQVFTYSNPEAIPVGAGDLVRVRLQGRRHVGLVVDVLDACPVELVDKTIRPIESVLQSAAVDPNWQGLLKDVAEACQTSFFKTLKTALPPGWLGQRRQAPSLTRRPSWLIALAEDVPLGDLVLTAKQQELLNHLAEQGEPIPLAKLCGEQGYSRAVLKALENRGLARRLLASDGMSSLHGASPDSLRQLTQAQVGAVAAIGDALPAQTFLLWGITGSGKTEVYLQAAAQALAAGQSSLVLTPEIGLIPQLLDRCRERFGEQVVEFHSGMGDADRVNRVSHIIFTL